MNWRVSDFNQIMMMMMKVNDDDGMVFQGLVSPRHIAMKMRVL